MVAKYPVPSSDTIISSIEFRFMIDRALLAHRLGRSDVQRVFSHAAQGLLEAALPEIATSFSKAASRQGQGDVIAAGMIPHLTPRAAAAVCVVLMIRGARSPAIKALKDSLGLDPTFDETIRILCRRLFVGDADEACSRPSRFAQS